MSSSAEQQPAARIDTSQATEIARQLAEVFATRALQYDRDGKFPVTNFEDLAAAGLLAANVPEHLGGLGLGVLNGNPIGLWAITRALAFGDPATAQPYHVHTNEIEILGALATEEQQRRYFRRTVAENAVFGGYGSQRTGGKPVLARRQGDGWVLSGDKYFATNVAIAKHALVWALLTDEPGDPLSNIQVFYIRQDEQPGFEVLADWWDQFEGLRATESHHVHLREVFVPDEDVIGAPGEYITRRIQSRSYAHFAASFIGIADRLLAEQAASIRERKRETEPSYLQRLGRGRSVIEAAWALLERTSRAYVEGDPKADSYADSARYFAERALRTVLEDTQDSVGSAAFSRHGLLAKLNRDVPFYIRHENHEHVLQAIGSDELARAYVNPANTVVLR